MVPEFAACVIRSATLAESFADNPNPVIASATIVETVARLSPEAAVASRTPAIPSIICVVDHPAFAISVMASATSPEEKAVVAPKSIAVSRSFSNSGTIGVSDLGESYKYVAPLAQSMGLSIEDVTTALSAMSMAGIKGSQAGTSLRTVLANMAKPSDTVANAMEDLGIEIANADGSFKSLDEIITIMRTSFNGLTDDQKAYYATALAGKEGMSGLISLLNLTQEEYDALTASMNNCTGVAGETAAVMQDNLQSKVEQLGGASYSSCVRLSKVEQLGGALESLAIKLSEYVIPFLTGLIAFVLVPLFYRMKLVSIYEYLENRFGTSS